MKRPHSRQLWSVVGRFAGVVALAICLPGMALAAITVIAPNVSLPESSSTETGTFEVVVDASGGSLPEVSDFTVNLQDSPTGSVTFTGGGATTVAPYIFAGQSTGPTVQIFNSGTTIEGSDFAGTPPTLANGDGLLAVNYSIAPNTSGTFNLSLITSGDEQTALNDQNANPIAFSVQNGTLTVVPSTVYWNGGIDANWNTLSGSNYNTNWSTSATGFTDAHALPGANTDVNFTTSGGGSNDSTTLGTDMSIKGLTFTSAATHAVSISGNTLTIGSDGLTLQSGAAAPTINGAVTLGANQTWTVAGSNPLTVAGTLSFAGQTLAKAGSGTLRITSAPSLASGSSLQVNAGTVQINNTTAATVGANVNVSVVPAATLQLAGSASALSNSDGTDAANITNNGSLALGGELLVTGTNQIVNIVSGQPTTSGRITIYAGDTVVGNGTPANLTATEVLQNSITIGDGSSLTILPSGSGGSTASDSVIADSAVAPSAGLALSSPRSLAARRAEDAAALLQATGELAELDSSQLQISSSGSSPGFSATGAAVPEPAGAVLFVIGGSLIFVRRVIWAARTGT